MDFIKRHYEKLLLLLMLVLFIGIMIYVVGIAEKTRKHKDDALTVNEKVLLENPVVAKKGTEAEFNISVILATGKSDWQPSKQREFFTQGAKSVPETYSDLVAPVRISTCPHCKELIPRYYFKTGLSCPACAKGLHDVSILAKQRRRLVTESDWDGDGMPNTYETTKGLNPRDFDDQLADADRDGFSNLFEYENDTDPKNPRSRMPHWWRLRYISNDSVVLPVKFKVINTNDTQDKTRWLIQIAEIKYANGKEIENSRALSLGDEIRFDRKTYKIVDATFKQAKDKKGNVAIDESTIKVQQVLPENSKIKPDVLIMKAGLEVRSNDKRLTVEDVGKPLSENADKGAGNGRDRYTLRVGDDFSLGNRRVGVEKYRLLSVDESAKTASFARSNAKSDEDRTKDALGKKILVTRDSEISEDVQVANVKAKGTGSSNKSGASRR